MLIIIIMSLSRVIQSTEDFDHVQEGINNIGRWVEGTIIAVNVMISRCGSRAVLRL